MYFRKKNQECLNSYKIMLKLILIFESLLWRQCGEFIFFQLKQQFTYFLSIIQWKTEWNKDIFLKKELCMSYVVFLHKSDPTKNP